MSRLCVIAILFGSSTASAATLVSGPWIVDARSDRVTIGFELDEAAPANVIVRERNGEERTTASRAAKLHRVVVSDLAAATRFQFRVVVSGRRSPDGTFQTAPAPGTRAKFVVLGDTRTDHEAHARVVRAILRELPDVVVHTGDFVSDGTSDEDWRHFFEVERRLLRRAVLVPTMGNHESYRDGGADRYRGYLALGDARPGAEEDAVYRWGDTLFLLVSSCNDGFPGAQRRFFEKKLAEVGDDAGLRHRIAVLHAGPFSSGHHGANAAMVDAGFVDFLQDAGVDLVLSGHDHDYERGVADVPYVVTGGGGAPLYPTNSRQPHQERFESVHHFLELESEGDALRMWARRADGSLIEECVLNAGAWECRGRGAARGPTEGAFAWVELVAAGGAAAVALWMGARVIRKRRTA